MARNTPPGPGVDFSGQSVIDPTANVIRVMTMVADRQDDLRNEESKLRDIQNEHLKEIVRLEADHAKELRVAETARIDAIRAVDVAAVQRAAEVAAEAVQTLAAQVPITAEAVRTSLAAALNPILNDIAELRKVQYEQQGQKQAGDDPVMRVLAEIQRNQALNQGAEAHVDRSGVVERAQAAGRTARTAIMVAACSTGLILIVSVIGAATHGKF